jgi:hypothetical protein
MPLERIAIHEKITNLWIAHNTWGRDQHLKDLLNAIIDALILLDKRSAHCPMCVLTQGTDDDNHTNG